MIRSIAVLLALGLVGGAHAQSAGALPPSEEMTTKVRELGWSVGNTFACADETMREEIEADAHVIFDLMLKDVGSDLGWTFATSAGFAASMDKAELDCPKHAETWQQIRSDFGLVEED